MGFASWKGECLQVEHLEVAITASEAFEVDHKGAGAIYLCSAVMDLARLVKLWETKTFN